MPGRLISDAFVALHLVAGVLTGLFLGQNRIVWDDQSRREAVEWQKNLDADYSEIEAVSGRSWQHIGVRLGS